MPHMTRSWDLWRHVTASDTVPTTLETSKLVRPRMDLVGTVGLISVRYWEEIAAIFYGKAAENKTFSLACVGWMDNGPGEIVFRIANTVGLLGAHTFTEEIQTPQKVLPSAVWFQADFGGGTPAVADALTGAAFSAVSAAPVGTHLIIPTKGFTFLQLFIVLDGAAASTEIAALWRPTKSHPM